MSLHERAERSRKAFLIMQRPLAAYDRIAELEQCLREARENIESWADYVPEMFREKHGLQGDLAAIDRVLGGGEK